MNILSRDIGVGEIVVVSRSFFGDEVDLPLHMRAFVCMSGAGMSADSSGTEINGYWYSPPPNEDIIEGLCIDEMETVQFHANLAPVLEMI